MRPIGIEAIDMVVLTSEVFPDFSLITYTIEAAFLNRLLSN